MSGITKIYHNSGPLPGIVDKQPHAPCTSTLGTQRTEHNAFAVFQEVFGPSSSLPPLIKMTIGDYIPKETEIFSDKSHRDLSVKPFGSRAINLTDPRVFKSYLSKECQTEEHAVFFQYVAKMGYEVSVRRCIGNDFIYVYPLYSEVLAYAMELLKKNTGHEKIALEIAGANGQNANLLGYTDASRVINIDTNLKEIQIGNVINCVAPENVNKKLEWISADCFNLLKSKPELKHKIDVILCRNLLHYFNKEKMRDFFKLIGDALRQGGRAILSVNSIYQFKEGRKFFEENPDEPHMMLTQCYATDSVNKKNSISLFSELTRIIDPRLDEMDASIFKVLYEKSEATNHKWKVFRGLYQSFPSALREKIKAAVDKHMPELRKIKSGKVTVVETCPYFYSEHALARVCKAHGFEVEATCIVGENGHVIQGDPFEEGSEVVVVCKKS